MNGTGNPNTGHFMGDTLEWLKRATTPHNTPLSLAPGGNFTSHFSAVHRLVPAPVQLYTD